MSIVVCTIFENDYHLGVAALINSLYRSGFRGEIYAAYRGDLPDWVASTGSGTFKVADELNVIFCKTRYDNHLTNFKPSFMLDVFESDSNIEGVVYFDPDIIVTVQWSFFCEWIGYGLALCSDVTRFMMHPTHPIKQMWKERLGSLFPHWRDFQGYANAGFVGVGRNNISFLSTWKTIIDNVKHEGLNQKLLSLSDPCHPFSAQDQDALNAAIHLSNTAISLAGQAEMGFSPSKPYMAHALGSHKPWRRRFVREALHGRRPSFAARQYWRFVEHPIRVFSPLQIRAVGLELMLARVIAGVRE